MKENGGSVSCKPFYTDNEPESLSKIKSKRVIYMHTTRDVDQASKLPGAPLQAQGG
jgi:hypothetical protein